jgi:DNA-binding winged helix-turn-helix (wHTH) protein
MASENVNTQYEINFETQELVHRKTGLKTKLEPRLTKLLQILMNRQGVLVNRQEIIKSIWGNYESGDELLTHSVSLLRKHLEDSNVIKTIPKKGYIFIGNQSTLKSPSVKSQSHAISKYHVWALFILLLILLVIKNIFWPHH